MDGRPHETAGPRRHTGPLLPVRGACSSALRQQSRQRWWLRKISKRSHMSCAWGAHLTNGGVLMKNRVPRVLQATAERGSRRSHPAPNQWPACGTSNKTNAVAGGLTRACPDNEAAGRFGGAQLVHRGRGTLAWCAFRPAPALCLVVALLCSTKPPAESWPPACWARWRPCALQSFARFYLKPRLSTALFKSPLVLRCRDIHGSILPPTPWPSLILCGLIWTTFSPRQDVPQTRMSPELE